MSSERDDAPYREELYTPRFVCIVCFKTVVRGGGTCGRCNSPTLPLNNAEVLDALRERARKQWSRRAGFEWAATAIVAALAAVAVMVALTLTGILSWRAHGHGAGGGGELSILVIAFVLFWAGASLGYARLRGDRAYFLRRFPEDADAELLVKLLGLKE